MCAGDAGEGDVAVVLSFVRAVHSLMTLDPTLHTGHLKDDGALLLFALGNTETRARAHN